MAQINPQQYAGQWKQTSGMLEGIHQIDFDSIDHGGNFYLGRDDFVRIASPGATLASRRSTKNRESASLVTP